MTTSGYASDGIFAEAPGDVSVTSGTVTTSGDFADGIDALSSDGNVSVTSGWITTGGDYGTGIAAEFGALEQRVEALQLLVELGDGEQRVRSLRALADIHRGERLAERDMGGVNGRPSTEQD